MRVHRFLEEDTTRFALTPDVGGHSLPVRGSVWLYAGTARLEAAGPPPASVRAQFLRKGYFLWPEDDVPPEPRSFR